MKHLVQIVQVIEVEIDEAGPLVLAELRRASFAYTDRRDELIESIAQQYARGLVNSAIPCKFIGESLGAEGIRARQISCFVDLLPPP